MCERTDWMNEITRLKWAISACESLFSPGSSSKEVFRNAARGIEGRLDWILEEAKRETKREPYRDG